jgi:regulator of cell morphogenesis and NO signaling
VNLTPEQSVRDVLLECPAAAQVFEQLNIDYCCRGNRALGDALSERGVSLQTFLGEVDQIADFGSRHAANPDWRVVPLRKLIRHIIDTHHAYLRVELPALDKWITAISREHPGEGELMFSLQQAIQRFQRNLEVQMSKEEAVLFPAISKLETGEMRGVAPSGPLFGSVANLARVMEKESTSALGVLSEIRILSKNFAGRPEASAALKTLFDRLRVLEADTHQHLHLENNVLFPRAIGLEKGDTT